MIVIWGWLKRVVYTSGAYINTEGADRIDAENGDNLTTE